MFWSFWTSMISLWGAIAILMLVPSSQACSCLGSDQPQYCSTDFFALVHIGAEQTNPAKMTVRYRFKALRVIRDPLHLLSSRRYKNFHTYMHSAACGVELKVGERYLIGGNLDREHDRLVLDLCGSYVEPYSTPSAVFTKEFQSLLENCNSEDPSPKPPMPPSSTSNETILENSNQDNKNGIWDRDVERMPTGSDDQNQPSTSGLNPELEREGKPIMKFFLGRTEDDNHNSNNNNDGEFEWIRHQPSPRQQQQINNWIQRKHRQRAIPSPQQQATVTAASSPTLKYHRPNIRYKRVFYHQ